MAYPERGYGGIEKVRRGDQGEIVKKESSRGACNAVRRQGQDDHGERERSTLWEGVVDEGQERGAG